LNGLIETSFQPMKEELAARTMAELRHRAERWLRAEGGLGVSESGGT
jgi:hypothetical protein